MKTFIGIDPGLSGAIAVITDMGQATHDMPTLEIKAGKKIRHRYNVSEILRILRQVRDENHANGIPVEVWLEDVHAMPGQGVTSMFSMGRGIGTLETSVIACEMPLNMISPITWKKRIMDGQGKEKDAAVFKAMQLFPSAQLVTPRGRKLDGRAEALLIAEYGRRMYGLEHLPF